MKLLTKTFILAGAVAALCGSANAIELVTNGGFEADSGNFTSPPTGWYGDGFFSASGFGSQGVHSGSYAAFGGWVGSVGYMSQDLATTPGATYNFSFWFANDGGTPSVFTAAWDGTTLLTLANPGFGPYTQYSYTVTAASSLTTITFGGQNDPTWVGLDDVSVTPASSVPDGGSTIAMLGLALTAVAGARRKFGI